LPFAQGIKRNKCNDEQVSSKMVSRGGDIADVLISVEGATFAELLERLKAEKREAEACWKRGAPLSERRDRMYHYTQQLRCLLFWLVRKRKPRNCESFLQFRGLTESLVRQGVFPPATLAAFERADAQPNRDESL